MEAPVVYLLAVALSWNMVEDGKLIKNEYSWNLVFSAEENLQFLINWFKECPQYRDSDLYLSGESYAGHFVPQLAALIVNYNKRFSGSRPIRLKAIALGNPLLDLEISVNNAEYLWSHGVIYDEMLMLRKTVFNESRYLKEAIHYNLSKESLDVLSKQEEEIGSYTDSGDLILPICLSPAALGQTVYQGALNLLHAKLAMTSAGATDPCLGDWIHGYLNTPEVQEAFHAHTTHHPLVWEFCGGSVIIYNAWWLSKRESKNQYHTSSVKIAQKRSTGSPLQRRSRLENPINAN